MLKSGWGGIWLALLASGIVNGADRCLLGGDIAAIASKAGEKEIKNYTDLKRNARLMKSMCIYSVNFKENKYRWKMLLVFNPGKRKGPFWFLPHDNENSAFDAAVYAVKKYGGGFLAVQSGGKRYFMGQDPNRNFGETGETARICSQQKSPAPLYSRYVFRIIDSFRTPGMPYLALHNNGNGWSGNGGSGGISILKKSKRVLSYPAYKDIKTGRGGGLKDEDSMVYIAGRGARPPKKKLRRLLSAGLNVKYEIVDRTHNDCSMSNYVILRKRTSNYCNIETEHGDSKTQRIMIDRLLKEVK